MSAGGAEDAPPRTSATLIVPTHDQAAQLKEALASALAQDHPDLEVLVMDNASTDATPHVLESCRSDPRVRVVRNRENLGRVGNYRAGLEHARGYWVAMHDCDDVLLDPTWVRTAVERANRDAGIVMVAGGQRWRELADERRRDLYPTHQAEEELDGWGFFLRWASTDQVLPHLGTLYRADLARSIGFYTHDVLSSDWESLRRLCLRGRVVLMRRLVGEWRGHGSNVSRQLDHESHLANLATVLSPYQEALRSGRRGLRLELWKWRALADMVGAYHELALAHGELDSAKRYRQGLARRLGRGPGAALVVLAWILRPTLWAKSLVLLLGGPKGLARARRAWQRLTWSRPEKVKS